MRLFDSVKIRGMVLRNRILMAPMLTNLGYKSKRGRAYFVARAKGGVGAIVAYGIPPDLLINDQAWEQKDQRQSFIEGIRELTEEVHNLGAKIGIQLWHGNRFPAIIGGNFDRGEWVAPSARIEGNPPHSMVSVSARLREMTTQEIESLIQSYSRAAAQAKEAGFDFVEFHGAHSYLANQFFSPADNHRTDKYGGNLAGRMRFGIDCIQAIRGAVGEDYPIFYRFPAEEARPGGITLSESIEYAVELEKAGVDVLNVSTGTSNDRRGLDYHITPPYERPAGTYVHLAESIKRRVNILVAAVGRINSPGLAESILAEGKADLITIGRQLIADPEWPNKVADGEVEDIRPCLCCCECVELVMTGKQLQCAVNPMVGQEFPYGVVPEEKRKKVVVIGGGPAGMEAAATAAFRDHKVILFEKGDRLGGQLLLSGVAPYKAVHGHLTKYLMNQVEKSGVEVRLGWNGDVNSIQKEGPDVVILAAGAVPIVPSIPGVRRKIVVSALDVLSGQSEVGKKVVVVGGGMIGLETAELLSAMGKEVTILEMLEEVGRDTISVLREAVKERLKKAGVDIKTKAEVVEITTRGVKVKQGGKVTLFGGDSVVLACGMRSNNDLKGQLEKGGKKVSVIGDCAEPRRIRFAMEEGFRAGFEI